jgi:hypothetical protein
MAPTVAALTIIAIITRDRLQQLDADNQEQRIV